MADELTKEQWDDLPKFLKQRFQCDNQGLDGLRCQRRPGHDSLHYAEWVGPGTTPGFFRTNFTEWSNRV